MSATISFFLTVARFDRKLNPLIQKNLESHQTRNLKTAIMFSVCISFLIFAGTAFTLISDVIKKQIDMTIGADISAFTLNPDELDTFINEGPIVQFFEEQNQLDPGCIQHWSFSTPSLRFLLAKIKDDDRRDIIISDTAGYKSYRTNIFGIQQDFLNASMNQYYMATEIQEGVPVEFLADGRPDAVSALFTEEGDTDQDGYDHFEILV